MVVWNPTQLQIPFDLLFLVVARHLQLTANTMLLCDPHMLIYPIPNLIQAYRMGRSVDLNVTTALKTGISSHCTLSCWLTDLPV